MEFTHLLFRYHKELNASRGIFLKSPGHLMFSTENNPKLIHGFVLLWTAHSIEMTVRVESWIRRAGEQAIRLGINSIGEALLAHARHEADHDQMLVKDLEVMVQLWNHNYGGSMTVQEIRAFPLPENTARYIQMHEEVIAGANPYGQVAVEYEIERVSIVAAPRWVENVVFSLGLEALEGLSFLQEHILLDQGHTQFNNRLMELCLKENLSESHLIAAGQKALHCYSGFLDECRIQALKTFSGM